MENLPPLEERRHKYYILDTIFKIKYNRFLKSQAETDALWHEMHEAHMKLLEFTNKYGKYPYVKE